MTDCTTASSLLASSNFFRLLRAVIRATPKVAWKTTQVANVVVLASDTHEIVVRDLIPIIVETALPLWSRAVGLAGEIAPAMWLGFPYM